MKSSIGSVQELWRGSASGVRREKAALSQRVKAPPSNRSSRKQPEQLWDSRDSILNSRIPGKVNLVHVTCCSNRSAYELGKLSPDSVRVSSLASLSELDLKKGFLKQ